MKKLVLLLFVLTLFFAGCTNIDGDTNETTPPETAPAGYYIPESDVEKMTGGAVRGYELPDSKYAWIAMVGDRLMLVSDTKTAELTLISGNDGIPTAELELESEKLVSCQPLLNGFAYYDSTAKEAVFLDLQLQKSQAVSLPDEISGEPLFAADGSQVFFCVGNELRAIEVERKLNRLVKSISTGKLSLEAAYFNGEVLACSITYDNDTTENFYISSQSGQTLRVDNDILELQTSGDTYVITRYEGVVLQRLYGRRDADAIKLSMTEISVVGIPEMNGVVGCDADENGVTLNYYDAKTGSKTSAITLTGMSEPEMIVGDKWGKCIWLLIPNGKGNTLLRWDLKASSVKDENVYIETLYTAENPDTEGLELINERIATLNKKYGVRIRVWEEAVKYTGDYNILPEYQVPVINEMLDQLETVLAEFPKSFVSKSISSKVRICLVRSVDGQQNGAQFWVDDYAFISIPAGANIRSEFLKGFGYVVDSHVLGNSPIYDYWKDLNPKDFVYGETSDETLTTGENRAFYDVDSMKTGTIDRSTIFWQAMLPDNADMFKSETMQAKLKMVCKAIRDAWRLEREEEEYPWEQYLNEPIAYKKKR